MIHASCVVAEEKGMLERVMMSASARIQERSKQMRRGDRSAMEVKTDVIGARAGDFRMDFLGGDFNVVREWYGS